MVLPTLCGFGAFPGLRLMINVGDKIVVVDYVFTDGDTVEGNGILRKTEMLDNIHRDYKS